MTFRALWAVNRWTILLTALVMSVLFAAGVAVWAQTRPEPWAPLSYQTAPQTVLGTPELVTVNGIESTVVVLDWSDADGSHPPSFKATGAKCNNETVTIRKRTERSYSSIAPVGSVIEDGSSFVDTLPGCTTRTAENPWVNVVPQAVLDRAATLSARGDNPVTLWQFRGEDTPVAADGSEGVPAFWRTDTFAIRISR